MVVNAQINKDQKYLYIFIKFKICLLIEYAVGSSIDIDGNKLLNTITYIRYIS